MVELPELWCLKGAKIIIFLFLCFWFVLLFCRLLWRDLDELVLVMQHDPGFSMETLYEWCESWFYEGVKNSYTPFHMNIYIHKIHLGVELLCSCILTS